MIKAVQPPDLRLDYYNMSPPVAVPAPWHPWPNKRNMSLSNVFDVLSTGTHLHVNAKDAYYSDIFTPPAALSTQPQLNQNDASLSNIFGGAPTPAPFMQFSRIHSIAHFSCDSASIRVKSSPFHRFI
jgi:hypothetical protein